MFSSHPCARNPLGSVSAALANWKLATAVRWEPWWHTGEKKNTWHGNWVNVVKNGENKNDD